MTPFPHLAPLIYAKARGVELILVSQGIEKFTAQKSPFFVLIGDDLDCARGPEAFHRKSLRRAIKAASGCVIVSSDPERTAYLAAIVPTLIGRNSMLIETRLDQEIQWIKFVQAVNPNIRMLVSTVQGGTA